jgi:hypothetical protein
MAEVFGNVVGHWRVHTTADVIQQNDGAALIRAVTYFQVVDSWNYSRLNGNYGASVAGQTGSASTSQGITVGANGQQNLATKDVWVGKGRGNTNVGFGGYINITGYAAGSSSANGTITIGGKPSHTISYNANGGSGAPGNQTKWYGETLYLSNQKPSRTNYEFLGWSTSSNGGVNYTPGQQWYPDQTTTLYAVWKLTLVAPTITTITAMRCSPDGIQQNDGTSVKLDVAWSVDTTIDTANTGVTMKISDGAESSDNLTGVRGTFTKILSGIDTEKTYSFTATLTDKHLSTSVSTKVGPSFYLLDINETGNGLGIGQAAPDKGLRVGGTFFANQVGDLTADPAYKGSRASIANGEEYIMDSTGKWIIYNSIVPLSAKVWALYGSLDYIVRAGVAYCSVVAWYNTAWNSATGTKRTIIAKGLMPPPAINLRTFMMSSGAGGWDRRFQIIPQDDGSVEVMFMNEFAMNANEKWGFGFSYPLKY